MSSQFRIPPGYGIPLINLSTDLLPQPTMDALAAALPSASPDDIADAIEAYIAENPILSTGGSVHLDEGEPNFIAGAKLGDVYIDTLTGVIYQLEEG